jgi:hypothetical protein
MTDTALTILQKGHIQLSEIEAMIMAEAALDDAAFDPIPTKITIAPGGINVFSTSDGEALKTLTAIVVVSQKARAYWPEKGTGSPPLCSSHDGSRGVFNHLAPDTQIRAGLDALDPHPAIRLIDETRPIPDTFSCMSCPLAQWGSAHQNGSSKAQACKALRRLVVLVDGWTQPALLTLPPTSIKGWDTYCSSLVRQKAGYFAVRTKLTLEAQKSAHGDPYSIAKFALTEKLSASEDLLAVIEIRRQFSDLVKAMDITGDEEYPVTDTTGDEEPIPF